MIRAHPKWSRRFSENRNFTAEPKTTTQELSSLRRSERQGVKYQQEKCSRRFYNHRFPCVPKFGIWHKTKAFSKIDGTLEWEARSSLSLAQQGNTVCLWTWKVTGPSFWPLQRSIASCALSWPGSGFPAQSFSATIGHVTPFTCIGRGTWGCTEKRAAGRRVLSSEAARWHQNPDVIQAKITRCTVGALRVWFHLKLTWLGDFTPSDSVTV